MSQIQEVYKTINVVTRRINDSANRMNRHSEMRDDKNESDNNDTQNAACELSAELDERITDLENALCELTEE